LQVSNSRAQKRLTDLAAAVDQSRVYPQRTLRWLRDGRKLVQLRRPEWAPAPAPANPLRDAGKFKVLVEGILAAAAYIEQRMNLPSHRCQPS
jgi:hypothetical protein